jgi:hypothetical protein
MKPRMILLTAMSAAALGGGVTQIANGVSTDGRSSVSPNALRNAESSCGAAHREDDGGQAPARSRRLLHNPGLPPSIP